jgi:hypothetical protein
MRGLALRARVQPEEVHRGESRVGVVSLDGPLESVAARAIAGGYGDRTC